MKTIPAYILAAGKGTRLAPLTGFLPKPMMPLPNNDTVLGTIYERLSAAGVKHFCINGHHLRDKLCNYLAERFSPDAVTFFDEPEILGTGGPLVAARKVLEKEDFFILHNGDILLDIDFKELIEFHKCAHAMVTLVTRNGPENRVMVEKKGATTFVRDISGKRGAIVPEGTLCTYCGVAVISKGLLRYLPKKPEFCSWLSGVIKAMDAGEKCVAFPTQGNTFWADVGTRETYLNTCAQLPRAFIGGGTVPTAFEPIVQQGSARNFYRLRVGDEQAIFMQSDENDQDFDRFLAIGDHMYDATALPPKIYAFDRQAHAVVMEDLGRERLYDRIVQNPDLDIYGTYLTVINALIAYQKGAMASHIEKVPGVRRFDYDYFRWETAYFTENALKHHFRALFDKKKLERELDVLALYASTLPEVFIHRDFQSQNVIINDYGDARFVDFQGGRLCCGAYDLMALLLDPYLPIPEPYAGIFKRHYLTRGPYADRMSTEEFDAACQVMGLQRLMQCLGAYAFLAHTKGKMHYLCYIPIALSELKTLIEHDERFPELRRIVLALADKA